VSIATYISIVKEVMKNYYCRKEMIEHYHELNNVNKTLINGYNIKAQNYNEGIETMKKINHIIQKASRLRGTQ